MADDDKTTKKPAADAAPRVTTEIQSDVSTSADIGTGVEPGASTSNKDAASHAVDLSGEGLTEAERKELEGDPEAPDGAAEGDKEPAAEGEVDPDAPAVDLGEWKPDDNPTREKFDAHYFKEGVLNTDVLSTEFFTNYAKDPAKADKEGGLGEATYAYLKDTLGLAKDAVVRIEQSLLAQNRENAAKALAPFGGTERYEAATKWAREGGYTPAQRERFNKLRIAAANGGEAATAFAEAIEVLMARFDKVSPSARPDGRRGPPGRPEGRPSSPRRSTTAGGAGGDAPSVGPFKSAAEYSAAWSQALADHKAAAPGPEKRAAREKIEELRKQGRRSRFTNPT